jgi:uncharacterized membrane protein YtjA (UPF0391 family)
LLRRTQGGHHAATEQLRRLSVSQWNIQGRPYMLQWILILLLIAAVASLLGFRGVAGASAGVAKILIFIVLVVMIIALFTGVVIVA